MGITEQILDYQLKHGVFDNAAFAGAEGIAKRAVAEGFETLSIKQKSVLEPYLSNTCSGVTDPGGHHNECKAELEGEALLDAYHRCDDTECLVCESCDSDEGYYAHQWDRISQE
ncbi:hypothetical protein Q4567_22005 [Aliiglaciecola sp. 2_MG-2023]|uniref:hypothetical protein n=1 Tax=unclassified Aliiglaciecola TaxID=2593648 RepID=UPI0026E36545|nr:MULTISPECIES: hypothetical protein [unclassified Aliiglaciecola]MDO6713414.1 hypothetical protein [Aliiglaciecola sp. 2_MG-2023]MDO6754548.1 hypothetical protein [Aliiglaciecola sp. 1_MG-2023]